MSKHKTLLEDYLNKDSHIINEKVVVKSFKDMGSYITAFIEWETEEALNSSNVEIPLFDLVTFVYSKV